ncbi:unnamed protein product, partial [Brassica oleracea]
SLGNITRLETIQLSDNSFEGIIPPSLGKCGKCSYLLNLHIQNNKLTGIILEEIVQISIFVSLNMSNNLLTGSLTEDVGRLENLGDTFPCQILLHPKPSEYKKETTTLNNNKRDGGGEKKTASITVVLKVDMHCDGCASKLVKTVRAIQGVETVKAESESGKVTVTGDVDPAKLREQLEVKIKKKVELVSPQPNKEKEKEDNNKDSKDKNKEKKSEEKKPKEAPVTTAVLKVGFHRERCIEKIQKTVSKTKGVSGFSIDQEKQLVTVKGTMDVKKLVRSLTEKLKRNVEIVATAKNGNAKEKQYVAAQPAHGSAYFPGEDGDSIEYLAPQIFSDDNPNACFVM